MKYVFIYKMVYSLHVFQQNYVFNLHPSNARYTLRPIFFYLATEYYMVFKKKTPQIISISKLASVPFAVAPA
jgi:hypothetical protein